MPVDAVGPTTQTLRSGLGCVPVPPARHLVIHQPAPPPPPRRCGPSLCKLPRTLQPGRQYRTPHLKAPEGIVVNPRGLNTSTLTARHICQFPPPPWRCSTPYPPVTLAPKVPPGHPSLTPLPPAVDAIVAIMPTHLIFRISLVDSRSTRPPCSPLRNPEFQLSVDVYHASARAGRSLLRCPSSDCLVSLAAVPPMSRSTRTLSLSPSRFPPVVPSCALQAYCPKPGIAKIPFR